MQPPLNTSQDPERIAQRLRAMFGMYDIGIDMLRCRLQRESPNATQEQINAQITAFLHADRHTDNATFKKRTCSRFSAKS